MRDLLAKKLLFFGGKGGVGKTTCASAMALAASREGKRVLLVSTDPAHSTSDIFERHFTRDETEIYPRLKGIEIDAEFEGRRYIEGVREQISKLFSPNILKETERQIELASTMPGVEEVALFDRVTDLILSRESAYDLMVFDTAPTGHTLRLLRMPELMTSWIHALSKRRRTLIEFGEKIKKMDPDATRPPDPILAALERRRQKLEEVRLRLIHRSTTGFLLVLVPERLPIEETARTARMLQEFNLNVAGILVNRVLPDNLSGDFYQARRKQELLYREEIDRRFSEFPRQWIPQFESDIYGLNNLERVSELLLG